jgi:hypothetical protein
MSKPSVAPRKTTLSFEESFDWKSARSQMMNRQLPSAHDSLLSLMEEANADPATPKSYTQEVRAALSQLRNTT